MDAGTLGGIIGATLGTIGGLIGTYFSIKHTNGPKERAFMLKAALATWLAVILFLSLLLTLPTPYRFLLWIPYIVLLPIAIVKLNRAQAKIRTEERGNHN